MVAPKDARKKAIKGKRALTSAAFVSMLERSMGIVKVWLVRWALGKGGGVELGKEERRKKEKRKWEAKRRGRLVRKGWEKEDKQRRRIGGLCG